MKSNQGVISAMLGFALLAAPLTASAHDNWRNRAAAPAYHHMEAYRPAYTPRANFRPPVAANDWRWRNRYDRENYRPVGAANCPAAAPYNPYSNSYQPYANDYRPYVNNYQQGYYPQNYNYAPPVYAAPVGEFGAPMGAGMANLMNQRNSAQLLYQQAVRNGNRVRAKHLNNDIVGLNKRIAGVEQRTGRGGYNPVSYNSYAPSPLNNGLGYGANNGYGAMLAPLIGNYIH